MHIENELMFTMLGPSGAGKTTLLACMNKQFETTMPGAFFPTDPATFGTLNQAYRKLEAEANSPDIEFAVDTGGTEDLRQYAFSLKGRKDSAQVRFYDFPGGWMTPNGDSQVGNYNRVIDVVQKSMVIITAVNTPYLMEYGGRYKARAGVDEIEQVIRTGLMKDAADKLVLLVPIKCEKYTRTPQERQRLRDTLKQAFAGTLKLGQNPVYRGRLAVVMLPVQTVGNAQFSRFEMNDGQIVREVYLKNRQMRFNPKDTDQPLRFAMSFLLNEFEKNKNPYWQEMLESMFSWDNLREVADFIRDGMRLDDPEFEIACGRELLDGSGLPAASAPMPAPAAPAPQPVIPPVQPQSMQIDAPQDFGKPEEEKKETETQGSSILGKLVYAVFIAACFFGLGRFTANPKNPENQDSRIAALIAERDRIARERDLAAAGREAVIRERDKAAAEREAVIR